MKVTIHCRADGDPIVTSSSVEDGTGEQVPIDVDYICWEWQRGQKPRIMMGVDSDIISLQADVDLGGPAPPVLKT